LPYGDGKMHSNDHQHMHARFICCLCRKLTQKKHRACERYRNGAKTQTPKLALCKWKGKKGITTLAHQTFRRSGLVSDDNPKSLSSSFSSPRVYPLVMAKNSLERERSLGFLQQTLKQMINTCGNHHPWICRGAKKASARKLG
jgi:hypothetical protein